MNPAWFMPFYEILFCLGRNESNINPQNVQTCAFKTFLVTALSDLLDGQLLAASLLFLE